MCLFINWCGASMDLLSSQNHLQIISVPEINKKGSFKNVKDGEFINDVKSMVAVEKEPNERQGRHMCKKKKKKLKKHMKYLFPLLIGWLLIKSILLPVALKGLALLSGKAVVLSLMSLVLAAILGLRRLAQNITGFSSAAGADIAAYKRKGLLYDDDPEQLEPQEGGADPYSYYRRIDRH
ncbi:hypothetical protein PV328_003521 [Microctonus aethiopoides]|uniref:Uncharacterized protein n=1 Tax=Microctonus aethiopoides TaxID=144406 RepID=A0AA39F8K5_9HYME|nr:hypothetical protein PV328_003521 [Microctonus aethiopoides]